MAEADSRFYNATPHLLGFLDALGFSREIMRKDGEEIVNRYFEVIEHVRTRLGGLDGGEDLKVTTIGDSVILAIKCPGDRLTNNVLVHNDEHFFLRLQNLTFAIAILQAGLARENIWTRGAVTYDDVHFGDRRVVGPAFHRAFSLESKVAIYPRVILDGSITRAAKLFTVNELIAKTEFLYDFQKQRPTDIDLPKDVPTFVDFLSVAAELYIEEDFLITVGNHLANRLRDNVEHYTKYRWLADYWRQNIESRPGFVDKAPTAIKDLLRILRDC